MKGGGYSTPYNCNKKQSMSLIEVRPIEKERWHGLKGRDAITRPVTIEALVNGTTGKLATGLTEEDRIRLEKETGYDLSPDYNALKPHPFWSSPAAFVKLEHKTNIIDTSSPLGEIRAKILKASDLVANSQKEYDEGKFPLAQFVIFDEREEVELKASKAAVKRKVIIEADKLSTTRKAELIQVLLGISVRNQSNDFIDLKLDEAIDKEGPQKVLDFIKRDKARTSLHATVLEAIHKNVLRKDGTAVYYMDDQLGFDIESAIDYLQDTKNQALKAQVIEKLN